LTDDIELRGMTTTPSLFDDFKRPPSMGIREFARELGVDDKAVRKAIATSRIPPAAIGRDHRGRPVVVDVDAALAGWYANVTKAPPAPAARVDVDAAAQQSLVQMQRLVAEQRARRLQFDNDLRSGTYVAVQAAKREAFESARLLREAMLNLPARLAPELAVESDPQRVFARLDTEIRSALEAIAAELEHAS
jgi:hypothetical protein